MTYIGIDISKDSFVAAYPAEIGYTTESFSNNPTGVRKFILSLPPESHCVMEATGNYCMLLLYMLQQAGIIVSMENPLKIKNFSRAMLSVVKTDTIDAKLICMYGEKMNPAPYKIPSETITKLKQKRTTLRLIKKDIVAHKNQLKALEALPVSDKQCTKVSKTIIKCLEQQMKILEKEITDISKKEFERQMKLLTSIKGIGEHIAYELIMVTGGFTLFSNAKQLSRFLGLCPTYQQSGTSVNVKGHINRNGDTYLRSQLYVIAFSSIRFNAACRETYERLRAKGKSGKVAIIAVANKLIRQAFAVVTNNRPYVDGYVSALQLA